MTFQRTKEEVESSSSVLRHEVNQDDSKIERLLDKGDGEIGAYTSLLMYLIQRYGYIFVSLNDLEGFGHIVHAIVGSGLGSHLPSYVH